MNTIMSAGITDDIELLVHIDRHAGKTLQRQLVEQLRQAILTGQLAPGRRLPSTRALADAFGISRNIAMVVYDELYAQGYLERQQGSGTFVSSELATLPRPQRPVLSGVPRWLPQTPPLEAGYEQPEAGTISFLPGIPDISMLPYSAWREIWRNVTAQLPPAQYDSAKGNYELRVALAGLLGRSRGIACEPDDIIITSSTSQALDLLSRVLLKSGGSAGFEEPGYAIARLVLQAQGASIIPVAVDDDGIRVDLLPVGAAAPLLVYVTPSHQYPLAGRLSLERRKALLDWAEANDSLIIEDDYESEFRYDTSPLPALFSLDTHERVVYIGTFSKVLTPALSVGYLIAPRVLRKHLEQIKTVTDFQISWPVQRALQVLIEEGHLERHIKRMRRTYAEKRDLLRSMLSPVAHLAQLRGLEAGLHAYLELRDELPAKKVAHEAAKRGVIVNTLDENYLCEPDRNGLVLGYSSLTMQEIARGASVLREVILQVAPGLSPPLNGLY